MDVNIGNQILSGSRITEAMRELTDNEIIQVSGGGSTDRPPQTNESHKPPQTNTSNRPPQ